MLEFNKYCIKEIIDLKDFITVVYILIDYIYQEITPTYIRKRRNIKYAILSDSEIITISIVGELLTIDSEESWLVFCRRNLRDLFPKFYDRTRFNRTRKALHGVIKETYYGFKLHVLTTVDGYVTDFVLTPSNINDREAVWELVEIYDHITILGDKGYVNKHLSPDLEIEKEIWLLYFLTLPSISCPISSAYFIEKNSLILIPY